jgi:hypothetical protein
MPLLNADCTVSLKTGKDTTPQQAPVRLRPDKLAAGIRTIPSTQHRGKYSKNILTQRNLSHYSIHM